MVVTLLMRARSPCAWRKGFQGQAQLIWEHDLLHPSTGQRWPEPGEAVKLTADPSGSEAGLKAALSSQAAGRASTRGL